MRISFKFTTNSEAFYEFHHRQRGIGALVKVAQRESSRFFSSLELCITHKFAICGAASFPFIPTGLRPPAQGWPFATAAGLPWVLGPASKQPQRGCAQIADDWRNTFGVENAS
jgi:hypothetical protein